MNRTRSLTERRHPLRSAPRTSHRQVSPNIAPASTDRTPEAVAVPTAPRELNPTRTKRLLALADVGALALGVLVACVVQYLTVPVDGSTLRAQLLLVAASVPIWVALAASLNLYVARAVAQFTVELRLLAATTLLWTASIGGLAFAVDFDRLSRRWVVIVALSVLVLQIIERSLARLVFHRLRRNGRMTRTVLIAGTDAESQALARRLQRRPELGYCAVGFLSDHGHDSHQLGLPVLGDLDSTEAVAVNVGATGVMIPLSSVDGTRLNLLTRRLTEAGLHVTLCSSLLDIDLNRLRFQQIDRQTLVYIEPVIRTGWRQVAQRVFDVGISMVGLLVTAPILAVAAVAIKLETPGPVLFRQRRVGKNNREFEILKLRTMVQYADQAKEELLGRNESDGPLFKIRDDPRVTRVGRVLRKYSIDELPQFWNVIRGEMSVCGPRPALPSEAAQWESDVFERLRVLPGITGIWQVSGRADTTFEEYKRLDLYYVDNWSLVHDLKIVIRTFGVVMSRRGAS